MVVMSRVSYVRWCCGREFRRLVAVGILVGLAAAFLVLVPSGAAVGAEPVTPTRHEQTDAHIVKTGNWSDYAKTLASGGSYGRASTTGASATVYFQGTQLDWIGMKGTTTGLVDVYLDSTTTKTTTINLTATKASHQVILWTSPTLANGSHYLRLVRSSSSGIGKFMTLDAVDIWGTITTGP